MNRIVRLALTFALTLTLGACANHGGDRDEVNKAEAAKTRLSLGLTYLKNQNYPQAKANLDKALAFAPKMAEVHFGLAYYYQQVGEQQRAEAAYQQALKRAPNNADIVNSYGAFLCQQGKYSQATQYFLGALRQPDYSNAAATYENLALCSAQQDKQGEAIAYLSSGLKHEPFRRGSLSLMVELLMATGQHEQAVPYLQRLERSGRVTPEMLWTGVALFNALGDKDKVNNYGKTLVSLYPRHELASRYLTEVVPAQATPATPEKSSPYHEVKKGENLYRISRAYNIKMQQLVEWNKLASRTAIYPGMKIYLSDPAKRNK